jgi:hypothetical protein
MMNGAEVVARILQLEGTEFLTCYPCNPLIDACARLARRVDDVDFRQRQRSVLSKLIRSTSAGRSMASPN